MELGAAIFAMPLDNVAVPVHMFVFNEDPLNSSPNSMVFAILLSEDADELPQCSYIVVELDANLTYTVHDDPLIIESGTIQ